MSDSIDDWGPGTTKQAPRATNGGHYEPKPLAYDPPKGPTAHMQQSPGLHGTNHGMCGTQGKH